MKLFSPAKINLYLTVTGRRADGFHSLVSLVVPLDFGDDLLVELANGSEDKLVCDDLRVPLDGDNLILKAAALFRERSGLKQTFMFSLDKRIPPGGGFGGGSSNAVTALKGMNQLCGHPLTGEDLRGLAARIGSDCPLFLEEAPVVIRGRGERVEPLPELGPSLLSWSVFLFSPGFLSSTADLFGRLAERERYSSELAAEQGLEMLLIDLQQGKSGLDLRNDLGDLLGEKYLYYDSLFCILRKAGIREYGITGSGSGAFALTRRESDRRKLLEIRKQFLDADGFMIETRFSGIKDK